MNTKLLVGLLAVMVIYAGAQDQTANKIARELANPNTVLTSLKFKTQFSVYTGTLPQADDQNGVKTLFQPTLPFPLKNGHTLYVRPTVPLIFDQPVYDAVAMDFNPGSGGSDISLTTLQFFGVYLPGRAWSVASSPIMNYNHETDEWTLPINIAAGKTVIIRGRPWKFALELNYYVKQPDAFGPKLMVGINISPVVVNRLADWF